MFGIAPPTDVFGANYAATGTTVSLPIANLPGVSQQEADKDDGDYRRVIRGVLDGVHQAHSALTDPPAYFTITKSGFSGLGGTHVRVSYTVTFDMDVTEAEVVEELQSA